MNATTVKLQGFENDMPIRTDLPVGGIVLALTYDEHDKNRWFYVVVFRNEQWAVTA